MSKHMTLKYVWGEKDELHKTPKDGRNIPVIAEIMQNDRKDRCIDCGPPTCTISSRSRQTIAEANIPTLYWPFHTFRCFVLLSTAMTGKDFIMVTRLRYTAVTSYSTDSVSRSCDDGYERTGTKKHALASRLFVPAPDLDSEWRHFFMASSSDRTHYEHFVKTYTLQPVTRNGHQGNASLRI